MFCNWGRFTQLRMHADLLAYMRTRLRMHAEHFQAENSSINIDIVFVALVEVRLTHCETKLILWY